MNFKLLCPAIALFLAACPAVGLSAPYVKNNTTNNKNEPPPKPDPVVIHFQSAQRQRLMGNDIMVIAGTEALTGKSRQFGVANQEPQDKKYAAAKYDPKPEVKSVVEKMKPGEYVKVEIKLDSKSSIQWADKVETYTAAEHEEEPGVYLWDGGYKDTVEGQDVFKIELVKLGKRFVTYAAMVPGEKGKGMIADPTVVASAEAIEKAKAPGGKKKEGTPAKEVVEATISDSGQAMFVTSLDMYQAKKQATFTKVAEAEVEGQKGQAVELEESGKAVTALLPGKLSGKRWVTDANLLTEAKKLKPGTAVFFKTREIEGKTYLRALAAAPKEPTKPVAKTADAGKSKMDELTPDKKK
jgi:hypothetical protein